MKEIKKYSQILNLGQLVVGSVAMGVLLYVPEIKESFSPMVSTGILIGVAALNGFLTKLKQDL